MHLFVFGMGYSGRATARFMTNRHADLVVSGTSRGYSPGLLHFDGSSADPRIAAALRETTHLVISIPPDGDDVVLRQCHDAIDAARKLEWICYWSTVGVYGDAGGGWVDEEVAPSAVNRRSQWRIEAERAWQGYAQSRGLPLLILRLAGIYGPGRSAFDKLRAGTARRIVKPGQVFNRIHVEDIARVTGLAAERKLAGLFNLADDFPAPPQDVIAEAAEMIGMPIPPDQDFDTADMTPMARSFYADNKRVSNARIKGALGIDLLYRGYREGLAAVLESEK